MENLKIHDYRCAIVLAGGLGNRLRTVVNDVPKPMAPIENRPFLEYLLIYLRNNGISKVVLCVSYQWEKIQRYFGEKFGGIEIIYSIEDEPLGTGGAIKKAMSFTNESEVIIINGDTFFNIDLKSLELHDSQLQISLKEMYNFDRYGCVETDILGYVTAFSEKKYTLQGWINGGVYLASRYLFDGYNLQEHFSFEEFLEKHFDKLKVSTRTFNDYFIDIGIPEDYRKAQTEIAQYVQLY